MLFPVMHECVIFLIQLVDEKLKGEIEGILWYENSYNLLSRFKEDTYELLQPEIPINCPLFPPEVKAPR